MTVLQQYYTSFVNKATGSAGFQIMAMSPGISPEIQAMISRLIAYRIPSGLDERAIETHPIALRYYYHNAQESILLCSQSNGRDEGGRPGNFFAHSVVMPPDSFATEPPFLYWRSPFWKKRATETTPISPLYEFQAEQCLDIIDKMWAFLAEDGRREAFHKLMCAVVHSEGTNRRIVIIDSDEHVALWVAAVSCMLPPSYRPLLSFATYHHDPYQSWFLITGTTSDSGFRASPEECVAYFVLNGYTNQTSDVESSHYANLVKHCTNPDAYDVRLLRYFAAYEKRFPAANRINEQLDKFAVYVWLHDQREPIALPPAVLEAIGTVLTHFEQLSTYDDEDLQELDYLRDILGNARKETRSTKVQKVYDRVVRLYQKHQFPTDALLREDLRYYTAMLLEDISQPARVDAIENLQQLRLTYGEAAFIQRVNESTYQQRLTDLAQRELTRHQLAWVHLGPYLRPSSHLRRFFWRSLKIWEELRQSKQNNEASALFSPLHKAIQGREQDWLQLLVDADAHLPGSTITYFYWKIVSSLPLEQREPYRRIIQPVVSNLVDSEFDYDLLTADLPAKVNVLNRWIPYTQHTQIKPPDSIVQHGLPLLQQQCNKQQWKQLAIEFLTSDYVAPLLAQWEEAVATEAFSELSFQQFSQDHLKLYQRYHNYALLSDTTRTVLMGMVAMSEGRLDMSLSNRLHHYLSTLTAQSYYREICAFMSKFLTTDLAEEAHTQMIAGLFTWDYQDRFWRSYWGTWWNMFTQLATQELERAIRLLSFWFALSPTQFTSQYVIHQFFLTLRQNVGDAQALPGFQQAVTNIETKASMYGWYPAIQELFAVQKSSLLLTGQGLVKQVQKRLRGQKGEEEALEQLRKFNKDVGSLLIKGKLLERHLAHIATLCTKQSRELFWSMYREHVAALLLSKDIDHIVELFSFWFDESFAQVGHEPYIAQSFFIGLPQVFEAAKKAHGVNFRETAQLLEARYTQARQEEQQRYGWYPLVQPFLVEQPLSERRTWWPRRSK